MIKYKISKYFLKKVGKKYVIKAEVRKYRFGFLIDFYEQKLTGNYKCMHELNFYDYLKPNFIQFPVKKQKAKAVIETLKRINLK